jgi:DNA-binding response OmpR family regulator
MSSRGTILIVEDDRSIQTFLREALTDEGYEVRYASTGDTAIAAMAADPPDLALVDLMLSGASGLEVFHAVRAQAIPVPVVIMTASVSHARELEAQGIVTCLRKPFDLIDLFTCVEDHIKR